MSNFEYLKGIPQYKLFSNAAVEAENVFNTSYTMCAIGCRKALELAVKWVYSADRTLEEARDNLQSLVHNPKFERYLDPSLKPQIQHIIRTGNNCVHTDACISESVALESLRSLFAFIRWVEYNYGVRYEERVFDADSIPTVTKALDKDRIRETMSLLDEKDSEIERLRKEVARMAEENNASIEYNRRMRKYIPRDMSEFDTRKLYIDTDLERVGWIFDGQQIVEEYEVKGMAGVPDATGFVDYVLFGKDGLPLAVIEAKRFTKDPNVGREQAKLYADCLERKFNRRPMMFTTNGFETYFWDDVSAPQRRVSGLFSRNDLQRLMNRRTQKKDLSQIIIDDAITDRYYQKLAIRAICNDIQENMKRKHLLVMATGTGKTRTVSSLTDVLSRGNHITNVLFLADRTALVKQALTDFKTHLPDMSLCNLCQNKQDMNARIVFSTYPTMMNAIDEALADDGSRVFTPAHFDLIIVDESHRSIFRRYRAIFEYFDAILVGLTATPKTEVDRNTYDFFDMEPGIPTYAYEYEVAVNQDHVLVPYCNFEVKTKFLSEGIVYDELSDVDKDRYEEDFEEEGCIPEFIPAGALNSIIFNANTVDLVLQDLMEHGIRVKGGDYVGKTIIFAQNKTHAEFILERFNALYPQYCGKFAKRVVCDDSYSQTIIDDFKYKSELEPQIVVSVDMMDTGIDVPDCVNLVFFKVVRSRTKFWQMIGRGTRLCPDEEFIDEIDGTYTGKRRFMIFDYCGNFEFFRQNAIGYESSAMKSLTQQVFEDRVTLISMLQDVDYIGAPFREWRSGLVDTCQRQIAGLNTDLTMVRLNASNVNVFRNKEAFEYIDERDLQILTKELAVIIPSDGDDESAKYFDKMIYDLSIDTMQGKASINRYRSKLDGIMANLRTKAAIPQVREKLHIIDELDDDEFWTARDPLAFERIRIELRDLMKYLDKKVHKVIRTNLRDSIVERNTGVPSEPGYDFTDYREKVNRYVNTHMDNPAIYKLNHNEKLTSEDYAELERIFTEELGTKEDYVSEFGTVGIGELIRRIVKVDHDSLMAAFSDFLNDASMTSDQIAFVHKIINHIENEGMMDTKMLLSSPFDKPVGFTKMFDKVTKMRLVETINSINNNALV